MDANTPIKRGDWVRFLQTHPLLGDIQTIAVVTERSGSTLFTEHGLTSVLGVLEYRSEDGTGGRYHA